MQMYRTTASSNVDSYTMFVHSYFQLTPTGRCNVHSSEDYIHFVWKGGWKVRGYCILNIGWCIILLSISSSFESSSSQSSHIPYIAIQYLVLMRKCPFIFKCLQLNQSPSDSNDAPIALPGI